MNTRQNLTGVLFNPSKDTLETVNVHYNFDDFYELLNCSYVEFLYRNFEGVDCTIVCDEDGKLKRDNRPSVFVLDDSEVPLKEIIVGNVLVFGRTSKGELTSLTEEECQKVKSTYNRNTAGVLLCN